MKNNSCDCSKKPPGVVYLIVAKIDSDIRITGNPEILELPSACILNSRQSKTPCGEDQWVKSTIETVRYVASKNMPVIASIGMNTWELVLWASGEYGCKVIVILPSDGCEHSVDKMAYYMQDFGLNLDNCTFLFLQTTSKSRSSKAWWESRDKSAIDLAYEIIPVSIRDGGHWDQVLNGQDISSKVVNNSFRIPKSTNLRPDNLSIEIPKVGIPYDFPFITHWTRRFYEPWPGEKSQDFYTKLVHSGISYSHSAEESLKNIISEKLLRGSSTRIKNRKPAVAFTGLHPSEAVKLMKWRSRYVRYTFEPYGVAISSEIAETHGIKPVTYFNNSTPPDENTSLNNQEISAELTQGYGKGDWPKEKEWRYIGDLNLDDFDRDHIRILVPNEQCASRIRLISPWEIIALDQE